MFNEQLRALHGLRANRPGDELNFRRPIASRPQGGGIEREDLGHKVEHVGGSLETCLRTLTWELQLWKISLGAAA